MRETYDGAMLVRDLEWIVVLAEHRHVTDTAAILGTTQPTLSRALARVEDELGTVLFERLPDGVHPTPVGDLVVEAARDIVARHRTLRLDLASLLDPDSGVVRLAFLDSMATSLVPQLLRDFHREAPRVRVLLTQEPAHRMAEDLASGTVDLAVTMARPTGDAGWHPLQEERLLLVVPPTHRLASRKRVTLADVADDEVVTTPVGFGHRVLVDGLYRDAGVVPRVSFESQDLATVTGLVAAGLGVGVVPEQYAGQSGTIGIALRTRAARRTIGLTWRRDRVLPPAAERLREFVVGRGWGEGGP